MKRTLIIIGGIYILLAMQFDGPLWCVAIPCGMYVLEMLTSIPGEGWW